MTAALVLRDMNTHKYLHVIDGNIPSDKGHIEWVDEKDKATQYPGSCYVEYAYKQFHNLIDTTTMMSIIVAN